VRGVGGDRAGCGWFVHARSFEGDRKAKGRRGDEGGCTKWAQEDLRKARGACVSGCDLEVVGEARGERCLGVLRRLVGVRLRCPSCLWGAC
jgi:hypothetical protein